MTIQPAKLRLVGALLFLALAGCGSAVGAGDSGPAVRDAGPRVDAGSGGGLPCEIGAFLARYCTTCHNAASTATPEPLETYGDLTAPSLVDPAQTFAQRALARMQDNAMPMPPTPSPRVPDADVAVFRAWVAAGAPAGTCDTMLPPDPLTLPAQCTSMSMWTRGNRGSAAMNPGQACVACHSSMRDGPLYSLAGTVYPSGHEPNNCNGATNAGGPIDIEVTGANGQVVHMTPNSAGNFFATTRITAPYTARVVYMDRERRMNTPQTSGDCNSCHTQDGATMAPGRIVLP